MSTASSRHHRIAVDEFDAGEPVCRVCADAHYLTTLNPDAPSQQTALGLGDEIFALTEGEAADFNTRTPHAFGNPGPDVLEVLCLFNGQGQRMHVRAAAAPASLSPTPG